MSTLLEWLDGHGLGGLHEVLAAQQIDVDVLPEIGEEDLRELGITLGPRRRLLKAIRDSFAPAKPVDTAPAVPDTAERRQLSLLFVDLVGSTELSARHDPEETLRILRRYQNAVVGEITRFEGYVARFMGDGVLAYFGWPKAHEDEAERAVRAALGAVAAVGDLRTPDGQPLAARAAIATGLVVVGDLIGEGVAKEASVTGDTPNIAARLQMLAEPGRVVIADSTEKLVRAMFELEPLGPRQLKGLDAPVAVYAAIRERAGRSRFEVRSGERLRPMVGRDQELALLRERWQQASNGEGQCVLLVGEAGIGKSRITRALIDTVALSQHLTIRMQCSPYHLDSALWPVVQQLNVMAGLSPDDTNATRLEKIEAMLRDGTPPSDRAALALMASLLGVDPEGRHGRLELTPQVQRARTLAVLAEQLTGLARHRPVLVVIEDVHWIDPSTLEFIHLALDRISRNRVLMLLTSRPDGQPVLAGHPHVTRLALNRLGRAAVEAITAAIEGSSALSDAVRLEIVARTDGVPLFVEELTQALVEIRGTTSAGGAGRDRPEAELNVPATLHDSLMARLDRLPEVKRVAQVAACIGRDFDYRTLVAVGGIGANELQAALDRLVGSELVFCRGVPPEATYTFKHALVRDAAANSLLRSEFRRINARIVEALEAAEPQPPPELVAWHAERAGLDRKSIDYLGRAGNEATAHYANQEASNHFDRALRLIGRLPASSERMRLELETLVAVGVPRIALHGYASVAVEATYRRAVELSEIGSDIVCQFQAVRGLWNCVYDRADLGTALELAQRLCGLAVAHPGAEALALGFRALGATLFNQARFAEARKSFQQGIEAAAIPAEAGVREHGEAPWVICRTYIAWTATVMGDLDQGIALLEESLAGARRIDHPLTLAFALLLSAMVHRSRDEPAQAAELIAECARISDEHGFVFWQAGADMIGGWAAVRHTKDPAGIERLRRGMRAWQASGAELHLPTWHALLADAQLALGAIDEAAETAVHGIAIAEGHRDAFGLCDLWRLRGMAAARQGHIGEARQCLETSLALAREQEALLLELRAGYELARLLAGSGDAADARAILAPIAARFPETQSAACVSEARELLRSLA